MMRVFYQVVLFVISSLLSINAHGVMLWQPINPSTQFSANGEYQLRVDPSDPRGRGPAQYDFYHNNKLIWSKQWSFTLVQYQISNQGEIAGVSKNFTPGDGARVVHILNRKGEALYSTRYPTTVALLDGPALPAISNLYIHNFERELRYQVWRQTERGDERIWVHVDLNQLVTTEHVGPNPAKGFFNRAVVADPASSNILVYQRSNQKEYRYCLYDGAYLEISCKQLASDDEVLDVEQNRERWRLQGSRTVIGFEDDTFWISDFQHLRRNYYQRDEKRWLLAKSRSLNVKSESKALPALIPEAQFTLPEEGPHSEKLASVSGIYVDEREQVYLYDDRQKRLVLWSGNRLKTLFQIPEEERSRRSRRYFSWLTSAIDSKYFFVPAPTEGSLRRLKEVYKVGLDGQYIRVSLAPLDNSASLRFGHVPSKNGYWFSNGNEIHLKQGHKDIAILRDSNNQWLKGCYRLFQNENGWLAVICSASLWSEDRVVVIDEHGELIQTIHHPGKTASVQVAHGYVYISNFNEGFTVFELDSGMAIAQFKRQQEPKQSSKFYSQAPLHINLERNRLYYFESKVLYWFELL